MSSSVTHAGVRAGRGPLELRLEAVAHQHHEVGALHGHDVVGRQFEVVRLGARRRQVRHVHARAADLLGGVGEGIEGRDHAGPLLGPFESSPAAKAAATVPATTAPMRMKMILNLI